MSNVQNFGAVGDGQTDSADAIQHAVNDGDGVLEFPRGDYRITRTIEIDLTKRPRSRIAIHGSGGVARLMMEGEGPAISVKLGTLQPPIQAAFERRNGSTSECQRLMASK